MWKRYEEKKKKSRAFTEKQRERTDVAVEGGTGKTWQGRSGYCECVDWTITTTKAGPLG